MCDQGRRGNWGYFFFGVEFKLYAQAASLVDCLMVLVPPFGGVLGWKSRDFLVTLSVFWEAVFLCIFG